MSETQVVIVGAARTALGKFLGGLAPVPAPKLGAAAIRGALERARVAPADVQEVVFGEVLTGGVGQAPARQAALAAGLPPSTACSTVNKVCGSALYAVTLGARAILLGERSVVVAGGMESMSNAPYLLPRARQGLRLGHAQLVDSLVHDGLWDPYHDYHMGNAAEATARELSIGREAQDAFALESYRRAREAAKSGASAAEIVPVDVPQSKGPAKELREDEVPFDANLDRLPALPTAFEEGGTITAGNASKLNDGAAAVVLMSAEEARRRELTPLARVVGWGGASVAPENFPTAPVPAIADALRRCDLAVKDIDLFEINEAFAVVPLAVSRAAGIDLERTNVRGGAISLGHPIGASGARVLVTLLHSLRERGARRGLATLCIGGGEAWALVVETP